MEEKETIRDLKAENRILREVLCNICMLDFKRDSIKKIQFRLAEIGMEKYMKSLKKKEGE